MIHIVFMMVADLSYGGVPTRRDNLIGHFVV